MYARLGRRHACGTGHGAHDAVPGGNTSALRLPLVRSVSDPVSVFPCTAGEQCRGVPTRETRERSLRLHTRLARPR